MQAEKLEEYFNRARRNFVLTSAAIIYINLTHAHIGVMNVGVVRLEAEATWATYICLYGTLFYFWRRFYQYRNWYKAAIDRERHHELSVRINGRLRDKILEHVRANDAFLKKKNIKSVVTCEVMVNNAGVYGIDLTIVLNGSADVQKSVRYADFPQDLVNFCFRRCEEEMHAETPWHSEYIEPFYLGIAAIVTLTSWLFY